MAKGKVAAKLKAIGGFLSGAEAKLNSIDDAFASMRDNLFLLEESTTDLSSISEEFLMTLNKSNFLLSDRAKHWDKESASASQLTSIFEVQERLRNEALKNQVNSLMFSTEESKNKWVQLELERQLVKFGGEMNEQAVERIAKQEVTKNFHEMEIKLLSEKIQMEEQRLKMADEGFGKALREAQIKQKGYELDLQKHDVWKELEKTDEETFQKRLEAKQDEWKMEDGILGTLRKKYIETKRNFQLWLAGHPILNGIAQGIGKMFTSMWGAIVGAGIFATLRAKLIELYELYDEAGKIAARTAAQVGKSFKQQQTSLIDTAIAIKESMPLIEFRELLPMMDKMAQEGINTGEGMRQLGQTFGELAYFVGGEAAEAMIPMVAQMSKLGQKIPNLDKGLGDLVSSFGAATPQATKLASQFVLMTTGADFNKVARGMSVVNNAIKAIGITSEGAMEFMEKLMSPDIRQIPNMFKPFAHLRKDGAQFAKAIGPQLDMMQRIAKSTPDHLLAMRAEALGVSAEMLASLKKQNKLASVAMQEQAKKGPGLHEMYTQATDNFMATINKLKERIGLFFLKLVNVFKPFLDKVTNLFIGPDGLFGSETGGKANEWLEALMNAIGDFLKNVAYPAMLSVRAFLKDLLKPKEEDKKKTFWETIKEKLAELWTALEPYHGLIYGVIGAMTALGLIAKFVFGDGLGGWVVAKLKLLGATIASVGSTIVTAAVKWIPMLFRALAEGLKFFASGKAIIGLGAITLAIMGMMYAFQFAGPAIKSVLEGVSTAMKSWGETLALIINTLVNAFIRFENETILGKGISKALVAGLDSMSSLLSLPGDIINKAKGAFGLGKGATAAATEGSTAGAAGAGAAATPAQTEGIGAATFASAMSTTRKAESNTELLLLDIKAILAATYQIDYKSMEAQVGTAEAQRFMALQTASSNSRK